MGFPFLDTINVVGKVIDRVLPDPAQKAAAQLELAKLAQSGELEELHADTASAHDQVEVDKIEAASDSFFKSGWRPFCGWICGTGLGYQFVIQPLLAWISAIRGWMPPPVLDVGTLLTLLFGLLGLGTLRTKERLEGVIK